MLYTSHIEEAPFRNVNLIKRSYKLRQSFLRAARCVWEMKSVDVDWNAPPEWPIQAFVSAGSSVSGIVPESSVFFLHSPLFFCGSVTPVFEP